MRKIVIEHESDWITATSLEVLRREVRDAAVQYRDVEVRFNVRPESWDCLCDMISKSSIVAEVKEEMAKWLKDK